MANPVFSQPSEQNAEILWPQLRQAIAQSSGFQRWLLERESNSREMETVLTNASDALVIAYLRQTLETLAY